MKRFLAVLLLCCCLLTGIPVAMAEPVEAPEGENLETQVPEDAAQAAPEETPEPEADASEEEPQTEAVDLSVLSSETHIRSMQINITLDESGRASMTQSIELYVVGERNELRFSFPEGAKRTDIPGYWTGSDKEKGTKYLTVSNRKGFTGTHHFTLTCTMDKLVSGGEASQILTLPLVSLQDYQIGELTFTVSLPQEFAGAPRFSSGYYNTHVEELMNVASSGGVITGRMNQIMRDNDTLSMTLALPEGYFAGRYGESKLSPVMTVLIFAILLLTVVYWFRTLKKPAAAGAGPDTAAGWRQPRRYSLPAGRRSF